MFDTIFINANVITMDPMLPVADMVAISGDKIASVAHADRPGGFIDSGARTIDCMRMTLLPGFVDAHCHVRAYAESLVSLNLSRRGHVHSIADIQRAIQNCCRAQPPGTWVRGKSYSEFDILEKRHPNRCDLDAAAPLHPVKLTHRSGHAHVLNSLALQQVGITAETGDPPEGLIDRDPETGMPTGILYGMSAYLAGKIPSLGEAEMERGMRMANEKLLSYGITSVQEASSVNDLFRWQWFEAMKARGILQPRLSMMLGWKGFVESQSEPFLSRINSNDFRLGGVKIIADEVTGSLHPSQEELNEQVLAIHEAGCQAIIHAVEEPVIEAACNAIAYALNRHPRQDHRHRIEHCSVCPPALRRKLAGLGITVVTQPSFIHYGGGRYLKTVAPNQLEHLYPIRSLLDSGLTVGAGSDFPISDPNPLAGICAAVTRMTKGGGKILPGEAIGVSDAFRIHTLNAAASGFEEKIKGSISPGKLADFVLLSEDPFAVDAKRIKDLRVKMTVLGGRIVWEGLNRGSSQINTDP
jgi:predicted amidohydrolase YtcJ